MDVSIYQQLAPFGRDPNQAPSVAPCLPARFDASRDDENWWV